jgi:hypothetical protein
MCGFVVFETMAQARWTRRSRRARGFFSTSCRRWQSWSRSVSGGHHFTAGGLIAASIAIHATATAWWHWPRWRDGSQEFGGLASTPRLLAVLAVMSSPVDGECKHLSLAVLKFDGDRASREPFEFP